MTTHILPLEDPLSPEEGARIESECGRRPSPPDATMLREFLDEVFQIPVATDPDIIDGFREDSSNLPGEASGLSRPRSTRECAIVMRACFAAGIPFTVSAGRSNLTGSATPHGGLILSLSSLTTPAVTVDAFTQRAEAPAGIIVEDFREQVATLTQGRLHFPVDPTSRAEATVGGALACNASGFTPGPAGAIRDWVDAIEFLTPWGLVARARRGQYRSREGRFLFRHGTQEWSLPTPTYPRSPIKNAAGPFSAPDGEMDFIDLIIGSEGLFGIVISCVLRLAPRPEDYLELFFSLPDEDRAVAFLDHVREGVPGGPGALAALEYFGVNCRRYMDHQEQLFHGAHPVGIYIRQPLWGQDIDTAPDRWFEMLTRPEFGIDEEAILLFDTNETRRIFKEARHSMPANSLEVAHRRGTFTIMTDTVAPPERFAEFLAGVHALLRAEGLEYLSFGHLGDCHLHFMILPTQDQLPRATRAYDQIVALCADLGGVYSGEHGTGKRKRKDFLRCYGPAAVRQIQAAKAALDPDFLLNRDNVIERLPTP